MEELTTESLAFQGGDGDFKVCVYTVLWRGAGVGRELR